MKTTVKLSFMMFVEWFIWGAWFVPLWLWLSKSGFTAGEIGWSYACTAIAAILSPILVGSLTDRFFSAQKVLAVLMFAGAVLMYFADYRADQQYRVCQRTGRGARLPAHPCDGHHRLDRLRSCLWIPATDVRL